MGTLPIEHTADLPAEDKTAQEKVKSMPSRSKKNSHPGIVAKGKTRWTSAQVAAEKAHEEEVRKKAEAEETANLQTLTQLNMREDGHRALQKMRAVCRISDIPEEESEGEFIPLGDDDSDSSAENDSVDGDAEEGNDEMEIQGGASKAAATKRVVTQVTKKTKQVSRYH